MKKTILAALLAGLLLLSGCQRAPAESEDPTPTPTQDQTAETPPVSPDPATSADPGNETPELPRFLREFVFTHCDTQIPDCPWLASITCSITPADREELLELIALDTWWEATDIPAMGLEGDDTLYDEEGHSLIFAHWDEEKCLILAKENSESYLYHAPLSVLEAFESFMADKPFLPDFIRYFEFDQIEINRTPYEDREGYKDFDVYLLDDTELLSFFWALDPDSWTVIREEELVAIMYFDALRARDPAGNSIILAPWDEEKCLVNCFYASDDIAVRYWAPASVLENALAFVEDLTPLGAIDYETARYYDLFLADRGFGFVVPGAGGISDDQMAAYMLTVLGYEGRIDYELGVSPAQVDEITQKHFGRKIRNYNTAWSKVLPSGNVTATGWDTTSGEYPVLASTPDIDEYGNITATFRIYSLPEYLWLDEKLPWSVLNHVREYLLTGHGDVFLNADEWSDMYYNDITFRIETETVYRVQKEYVVYDSSRMVD